VKVLECPQIGRRPLSEFIYGGAVRQASDVGDSDAAWVDHVFHRAGAPARRLEWWYHRPTSTWFWVDRDTASDEVSAVRSPARSRTSEGR
jgi:sarcosine oxidase subunit delta